MSNLITDLSARQGVVGLPQEEKFPWKEKKLRGYRLAELYDVAGMPDLANRAAACSTSLGFRVADGKKTLAAANFCHLRLCPACTARKAMKMSWTLSQVMNGVEAKYRNVRFLFLTLTVKNCQPEDLARTLDSLAKGWRNFHQLKPFKRAIKGWFRAIEITRNEEENTYHPHIHAILAVTSDYFAPSAGVWLDQKYLRKMWQKSMRLDYDPRVWICKTGEKAKGATGTDIPSRAASNEAAKYATKDSEFINLRLSLEEAAEVVKVYTWSLHKRRMTGYGGWLKDIARELKVEDAETDQNLINVDPDAVRADLAGVIEVYNWNLGVKDYVLTDVIPSWDTE